MSVIDADETFLNLTTVPCTVCGETEFTLRDGFYFCDECGSRQEQIRAVEVDQEADFNADGKRAKRQKIKVAKAEKPQITSWECYNYLLRGFVEDLLALGAKEELKLMVLQVWAAYLRRSEAAFFSKKRTVLPHLGPRFHKQDALILYNHKPAERVKRKRGSSKEKSSDASGREYRKSLRQLDESAYSQTSQTDTSFGGDSSRSSSSSGNSMRAINLNFTTSARRQYKRIMPATHLARHSEDGESAMNCHRLPLKVSALNTHMNNVEALNLKQLYGILAIALNLIEDEIQLSDLVRFIHEERITAKRAERYFPENIVPHCRRLFSNIDFNRHPDKFTEPFLRHHVGRLARHLQIRQFKRPNLLKLAQRYIEELNLPVSLSTYVERLMHLLPPEMQTRVPFMYAAYEARAMAYVVYVLKLLFGLDGRRELAISQSAQLVNARLCQWKSDQNNGEGNNEDQTDFKDASDHQLLFVWTEWVRFVEMRKVLVARQNIHFARQFGETPSTEQLIDEWHREMERQQEERELACADDATAGGPVLRSLPVVSGGAKDVRATSMQHVFQKLRQEQQRQEQRSLQQKRLAAQKLSEGDMKFQASYTPAHSYFRRLLALHDAQGAVGEAEDRTPLESEASMPSYMRVEHSQRTLEPFLDAQELQQHFASRRVRLLVVPLSLADYHANRAERDRDYVGIFRAPGKYVSKLAERLQVRRADFNTTTAEWLASAKDAEPLLDELEFKRELEEYHRHHQYKMKALEKHLLEEARRNAVPPQAVPKETASIVSMADDLQSLHSFDVFDETNMDPLIDVNLSKARRNLDNSNVLAGEGDVDPDAMANNLLNALEGLECLLPPDADTITLHTASFESWLLLGSVVSLNERQKQKLATKLPHSFLWLLDMCARTISSDWSAIYEQLLVIEIMFAYGVDNLKEYTDCLHFRYHHPVKDINALINLYRKIW